MTLCQNYYLEQIQRDALPALSPKQSSVRLDSTRSRSGFKVDTSGKLQAKMSPMFLCLAAMIVLAIGKSSASLSIVQISVCAVLTLQELIRSMA
ncbi:hypothetical protein RRG08_045810 [Elysia crispata]|uniref:Uncharacterized protein n=1 Tax=Elysia crispata TaxID=231223 RepID=A0AAE1D7E9_9GAST|nr:hypothetical protein RRG08_045810 [Elysia crispata]